ncbi:ATP-binding protein [Microcoleus sp. FACHB-SPT15]|uniref:hybrid sensor histidine kinase/response regulator n=1 Tax=Microcoleus sp. FACHB-SPT15 TaxID=2692830 RepID=UPI001F548B2B|nr:ATP-binding protein [Microcoleus sp. FACHB-SPT15]
MSQVQYDEYKKSQSDAATQASGGLGMTNSSDRDSCLILIADDDRFTRMMLRQVMETEGYKVEEAVDGKQCLAAYEQYKPDMVLLDAMMPVMDGFACCSQLQTLMERDSLGDSSALRTPVLMITGLNDQASVNWAFEAGATDLVTKPIHPPVLMRRVRRLLEASWAEKSLRERERQYRSVVENVKEVIFQTNAAGTWTFLNPAWTDLTGFAVAESVGTNFLKYVHQDDQQLHQELWQSLLKGKEASCLQEIRYLTHTGESRWVEIHAHPTHAANGSLTGISGIIRDITERIYTEALEREKLKLETEIVERKRTENVIRNALSKEKELAELQSQIITTISHEFRTPLTTIRSSSDLLKCYSQNWTEEKKLKHFQRIEEAVEHMSNLLSDVILIGQAEAGQLKFNPTQLDLENWCREMIDDWQVSLGNQAGEASPQIIVSVQGNATQANLDEKLLRQIVTNLLSNAVKFSPKTETVHFDLVCQEDQAIFCIRDKGIGIPKDEQEPVFDSFYRASNTGTIAGTGVGLAIAKKCVELHQGKITVDSEVGVGTTFTVKLPLNLRQT